MTQCLNPKCLAVNLDHYKFCQRCGKPLWLKDRYQALKLIGQGGFGKTFLAIDHDKPSKPRCVIKQFCPQVSGTDGLAKAEQLFAEEAKRLDELGHHDQIPSLLAYFTIDTQQYLVQEYIEGQNLEEELEQFGPFNQNKIEQLLLDLLPVLEFIHQAPVIHRDIKPENIIRRVKDQRLVLVDFGAAKKITEENNAVKATLIGSAEYVAPEQIIGKPIKASDLYSLGVTCLHLLTGVSPLDLFNTYESEWVWKDYLVNNLVDNNLGKVIDKMICTQAKKRYKKADDVFQDIQSNKKIKAKPVKKSNFSQLYGLAYEAYIRRDYQKAVIHIEELAAEFSDEPNVLLLRGHINFGLGQYELAQYYYQAVITLADRQDLVDVASTALAEIASISTQKYNKDTSIQNSNNLHFDSEKFIFECQQSKYLSKLDQAFINSLADYFQSMIDKILHYYSDHNASYEEAKVLSKYYSDIGIFLRTLRLKDDIKLAVDCIEKLKRMTDRHLHNSKKYQWSYSLEKEVLAKLQTTASNPRPDFVLIERKTKINQSNLISLTDLDRATINKVSGHLKNMMDKIIHYHKDHYASILEAEVISRYYSELSDYVKTINNQDSLFAAIRSLENLSLIVSFYRHDSKKYRWSINLENNALQPLKLILADLDPSFAESLAEKKIVASNSLKLDKKQDNYLSHRSIPANFFLAFLLTFVSSYVHTRRWSSLFLSLIIFSFINAMSGGNASDFAMFATNTFAFVDNSLAITSARKRIKS